MIMAMPMVAADGFLCTGPKVASLDLARDIVWTERSSSGLVPRSDSWRSISTPVDTAFADPKVATTISELTHRWCQRGSPKPVGSDRPTWRCRSGQFQAHDLPAPPRTREACPLLKMSEFGYVQRTIGKRRNLRECSAPDGK